MKQSNNNKLTKGDLPKVLLSVSPAFKFCFLRFLNEWKNSDQYPCYIVITEYAEYIYRLYSEKDKEFNIILKEIEKILNNCDEVVTQLIVVGVLEDFQNYLLRNSMKLDSLDSALGRNTKIWWNKLIDFWENGKPLDF